MVESKKIAIITGGAGGIGSVISHRLAEHGFRVMIVDQLKDELDTLVSKLRSMGYVAKGFCTDVSSKEDVFEAFGQIIDEPGRIDVLINCAGVQGNIGLFWKIEMEDLEKVLQINLMGTVYASRAVIPQMIKQGRGKIINFSGGGATGSRTHFMAYGISKTAVVRFTETLAEELRPYHIQVNAVAPGAVNTRMLEEVLEAGHEAAGKEYEEAILRKAQGGTSPDLAAELVCYLASEDSDWLTGRLISTVWDPWKVWRDGKRPELSNQMYTLRRVDGKNIFES